MNNTEFREFHEEKYKELNDGVKQRAIRVIREEIPTIVQDQIRMAILSDPDEWSVPYHFGWGMGVRNLLREKGILDNELPSGNWDDYYVAVVEDALVGK